MDVKTIMKKLDISTLGMLWAKVTGGWSGVGVYVTKAVTKLLRKAKPEDLKEYGEIIVKVAELVNLIVTNRVPEKYKEAALATVAAILALANHIKDGEYTQEEFDADIDNIEKCVEAWKNLQK